MNRLSNAWCSRGPVGVWVSCIGVIFLTSRQARLLLCGVGICGLLVGCGGDSRRVVTLWHQMRPGDRAVLADRIEEFERQNRDIRVRALYKENEELRSGLESAVLVGYGPDVVYGPSDTMGVYQQIGALQDLGEWFDTEEQQAFDPAALVKLPPRSGGDEQLILLGDRFGNHVALVYNRDLIDYPPETTEELLEIAKSNTLDENGDGRPEQYGLVWNYTEPFFVIPFLTGYGAWVFDSAEEGVAPKPALDSPASADAYEFVSSLRTKHRVLPESADYEAAESLFLAGKAAMIINGDWSWGRYLDASGIDAVVAPLPIVTETGLPMAPMVAPKGYSLSVAAKDQTAKDAVELIRFLTSEQTQQEFLQRQKVYPSRVALRDDPLLKSDPTVVASIQQIERGRLMPTAVEMRAVWDAMRPPYQKLMAGQIAPAKAADDMQQDALRRIETLSSSTPRGATAPLVPIAGALLMLGTLYWQRHGLRDLWRDLGRNRLAYAMALPVVALIFLTVLFPLAYNVLLSFSNMSLQNFHDWQIVGVHNYTSLLSGESSSKFWTIFAMTLFWTAINIVFHVAFGVLLAVMLNGPIRGKRFYRIALIIPWAVPAYITALTWRGMFDSEFGSVNQIATAINGWLPQSLHLPVLNWLTEAWPAFWACIVANVWLGFPFMMVIALGGLQGIPQDYYEAARIDRATRWQQFWHITVPMLKPVMLPAITLGTVWTFNNLNIVWLVSNGGEPADQTHILVSYVYKAVFNLYQYGYGAALSMVIFAMLLTFSIFFLNQTKAADAVA